MIKDPTIERYFKKGYSDKLLGLKDASDEILTPVLRRAYKKGYRSPIKPIKHDEPKTIKAIKKKPRQNKKHRGKHSEEYKFAFGLGYEIGKKGCSSKQNGFTGQLKNEWIRGCETGFSEHKAKMKQIKAMSVPAYKE